MTFVDNPTIAVVGAGASGVIASAAILRSLRRPARVVLFDGRGSRGAGLAYGTSDPDHVLNVPASKMSAIAEEPDHFVEWLRGEGSDRAAAWRTPAVPEAFAPRGLYASYLEDVLRTSLERSDPGVVLEVLSEEIDDLVRRGAGWRLLGRSGAAWIANVAVLALGYRPPALPPEIGPAAASHPRLIADPWRRGAFEGVLPDEPVLVLGAHLTMIDVALTLDRRGHRGGIVAVSPRGLLPLAHGPSDAGYVLTALDEAPVTARGLLRRLRAEAAAEESQGGSWRSVADAVRPLVPRLWSAMGPMERERFLRHVHPYWEIHRHRMPPAIAVHVESMRSEGRLRLMAGRVASIAPHEGGFTVEVRPRGASETATIHAGWIVNATGPTLRYGDDPTVLERRLFDGGVVRPGPLGFGLDAKPGGALFDAAGAAHGDLFTLGPPLRGLLWETTSIPEIRLQAADLARSLTGAMGLDRA
ncbi:MAG TPA: FAD/NAD(P)-binding protein [Candidatus Eisenbacteria bacterium]|nr:FAD/NAD(P)-binding protein [Candidatus Eisenbacteria bacterium]